MLFKEYLRYLNKLAKDYPQTLELPVISSSDDEGNGFNVVLYHPTVGHYDSDGFTALKHLDDDTDVNAVCLN